MENKQSIVENILQRLRNRRYHTYARSLFSAAHYPEEQAISDAHDGGSDSDDELVVPDAEPNQTESMQYEVTTNDL